MPERMGLITPPEMGSVGPQPEANSTQTQTNTGTPENHGVPPPPRTFAENFANPVHYQEQKAKTSSEKPKSKPSPFTKFDGYDPAKRHTYLTVNAGRITDIIDPATGQKVAEIANIGGGAAVIANEVLINPTIPGTTPPLLAPARAGYEQWEIPVPQQPSMRMVIEMPNDYAGKVKVLRSLLNRFESDDVSRRTGTSEDQQLVQLMMTAVQSSTYINTHGGGNEHVGSDMALESEARTNFQEKFYGFAGANELAEVRGSITQIYGHHMNALFKVPGMAASLTYYCKHGHEFTENIGAIGKDKAFENFRNKVKVEIVARATAAGVTLDDDEVEAARQMGERLWRMWGVHADQVEMTTAHYDSAGAVTKKGHAVEHIEFLDPDHRGAQDWSDPEIEVPYRDSLRWEDRLRVELPNWQPVIHLVQGKPMPTVPPTNPEYGRQKAEYDAHHLVLEEKNFLQFLMDHNAGIQANGVDFTKMGPGGTNIVRNELVNGRMVRYIDFNEITLNLDPTNPAHTADIAAGRIALDWLKVNPNKPPMGVWFERYLFIPNEARSEIQKYLQHPSLKTLESAIGKLGYMKEARFPEIAKLLVNFGQFRMERDPDFINSRIEKGLPRLTPDMVDNAIFNIASHADMPVHEVEKVLHRTFGAGMTAELMVLFYYLRPHQAAFDMLWELFTGLLKEIKVT